MLIECKESNICIKSHMPKFKYKFGKAGEPVEVHKDHIEKVLANPNFTKSKKKLKSVPEKKKVPVPEKTWKEELKENFSDKEIEVILKYFKSKGALLEALSKENFTFSESLGEKLKEVFIH